MGFLNSPFFSYRTSPPYAADSHPEIFLQTGANSMRHSPFKSQKALLSHAVHSYPRNSLPV